MMTRARGSERIGVCPINDGQAHPREPDLVQRQREGTVPWWREQVGDVSEVNADLAVVHPAHCRRGDAGSGGRTGPYDERVAGFDLDSLLTGNLFEVLPADGMSLR
jgi:hypothetical protein